MSTCTVYKVPHTGWNDKGQRQRPLDEWRKVFAKFWEWNTITESHCHKNITKTQKCTSHTLQVALNKMSKCTPDKFLWSLFWDFWCLSSPCLFNFFFAIVRSRLIFVIAIKWWRDATDCSCDFFCFIAYVGVVRVTRRWRFCICIQNVSSLFAEKCIFMCYLAHLSWGIFGGCIYLRENGHQFAKTESIFHLSQMFEDEL